MPGRIVAVDDQPEVLELLRSLLQQRGKEVLLFENGERALQEIKGNLESIELLVLDLDLGPGRKDGFSILTEVRSLSADLPVVILTGKGTIENAVRAMRLGANDFIEKDLNLGEQLNLQLVKLQRMLGVLRDNRRLREQNQALQERTGFAAQLVGADGGLAQVMKKILALADIPRPVLIRGERGTGKELVALALHKAGKRSDGPFVTVNCAAVAESLAEAELFGHEKGAFTDARETRRGRFELADGGTLFLDEIGNMPLPIQQKILRAIEYQSFERVRGSETIQVEVRVIAATNADIEDEMEAGRFRRDLYDRLAFDTIFLPPLRERKEDLPDLCRAFIERFRGEVAGVLCSDISKDALLALGNLSFPGNVRELKNLIERAAYRCKTSTICTEDLDLRAASESRSAPTGGSFPEQVEAFERKLLQDALHASNHQLTLAAKALGLGYDQLRRLVKKHNLHG